MKVTFHIAFGAAPGPPSTMDRRPAAALGSDPVEFEKRAAHSGGGLAVARVMSQTTTGKDRARVVGWLADR